MRNRAKTLSGKTVERLSVYRRILRVPGAVAGDFVYSHELAEMASGTAAQVRRDLMALGVAGHPKRGYCVTHLVDAIGELLDDPEGTRVILVGVGDLGRAVLRFVKGYRPELKIVAAFDKDPAKIGRMIHGYRCRDIDDLESFLQTAAVRVAIVAVPAAEAQGVSERLVAAGLRGIVNFAPAPILVPDHVRVERVDIATALEKVACLVRLSAAAEAGSALGDVA